MSNKITIELCTEDRARLDRLADLLDKRITQAALIMAEYDTTTEPDPIREALTEVLETAEAPKNAAGEAEAETPATTQPPKENPVTEESAPKAETVEPTITLEQVQQKVVQLAAGSGGSKKARVREIINAYAKKVSDLPEDKWAEVWDKLTALEKEV